MDLTRNTVSTIEREVISEIRALRASPHKDAHRLLINNPAAIMYHFIVAKHGHVRMRLWPIARELGAGMKKLQREFKTNYGKPMLEVQLQARLDYTKHLLRILSAHKIEAVSFKLGYREVRDFNHFFRAQTGISPKAWLRKAQEQRTSVVPLQAAENEKFNYRRLPAAKTDASQHLLRRFRS